MATRSDRLAAALTSGTRFESELARGGMATVRPAEDRMSARGMSLVHMGMTCKGDHHVVFQTLHRRRNPPEAASIVYYQNRRHVFGDMRVEILDTNGDVRATLAAGKLRGMNRVDWPMRLPMPTMPAATTLVPVFQGPLVEEGSHQFRIVKGPKTYEGTGTLVPDPRADYSAEDRRLQQRTALELLSEDQWRRRTVGGAGGGLDRRVP